MFLLLFLIFWKVKLAYFLRFTRSEYWYLKFEKWCWYFSKVIFFYILSFQCWFFWISLLISKNEWFFFHLWVLNVSCDRPEYQILKVTKMFFEFIMNSMFLSLGLGFLFNSFMKWWWNFSMNDFFFYQWVLNVSLTVDPIIKYFK